MNGKVEEENVTELFCAITQIRIPSFRFKIVLELFLLDVLNIWHSIVVFCELHCGRESQHRDEQKSFRSYTLKWICSFERRTRAVQPKCDAIQCSACTGFVLTSHISVNLLNEMLSRLVLTTSLTSYFGAEKSWEAVCVTQFILCKNTRSTASIKIIFNAYNMEKNLGTSFSYADYAMVKDFAGLGSPLDENQGYVDSDSVCL